MNAGQSMHPSTQVLILAGGEGERLLPLTMFRPKPMLPFGGLFRLIDFTLFNCLNSGFTDVGVLTQHRHEELAAYIRKDWYDLWSRSGGAEPIRCLPPASGKRYRGTADAVFQNLPVISPKKPEHVLVLSGDHVYNMDYRELLRRHLETDADVTISTIDYPLQDVGRFGVVEVDKDLKVTEFVEKPSTPELLPQRPGPVLVNIGVYVFKMQALAESLVENCDYGLGYDFGQHVIPSLIGSARVYAYDFRDKARNAAYYWRDVGTIDSYHEASMDVVRPNSSFYQYDREQPHHPARDTWTEPRVSGNALVSETVLSSGVRIEDDAEIERSVLMPGAQVAKGVRIRGAIIEEGVQIPAGFTVGWNLEQDRKCHTVSPGGVVVVNCTPPSERPVSLSVWRKRTAASEASRSRGKRSASRTGTFG